MESDLITSWKGGEWKIDVFQIGIRKRYTLTKSWKTNGVFTRSKPIYMNKENLKSLKRLLGEIEFK